MRAERVLKRLGLLLVPGGDLPGLLAYLLLADPQPLQHACGHVEKLTRETDLQSSRGRRHVQRKLFARKLGGGRHIGRDHRRTGKLQYWPIGCTAAVFKQFNGKCLQIAIEGCRGHRY